MSDPLQVGDDEALRDRLEDAIPPGVVPPASLPDEAEDVSRDTEADFDEESDTATATLVEETTTTEESASATSRTARVSTQTPEEEEETTTEATTTSTKDEPTSTSRTSTEETSTSTRRVERTSDEPTTSSTITSTSKEEEETTTTTTTSEISTSIEETTTSTERKIKPTLDRETPKETMTPAKLPNKDGEEDGLGTGTTIGIALAAAVGVGIVLVILGALLKWRQKRNVRKRTAGLANFTDINDFADTHVKRDPIELANEKEARGYAASNTNAIPVTPPYRLDVRQAQKRNSWVESQGLPEDVSFGDYTVPPAAALRGGSDIQPAYGGARSNMPLPGLFETQPSGGAFDPIRMENGYGGPLAPPMRQDSFAIRAATAAPVRNRHFPPAPGRSFTSETPYPYMPTGQR